MGWGGQKAQSHHWIQVKGHLLGQQRLISTPSLPSTSIPHLPGILSQPPTFQGTGEGGKEPWRGTDCPSSRGTSGMVLPLNLSVPVCRVGRMKAHFPCATPSHKRALSPQTAWPLPQLTVHPAHLSARLGTWTLRVTTVLMGSGGITPEATLRGSGPAPHTDPACLVTQKKIQVGGAPGAPRESSKTRALGAHQEGHPEGWAIREGWWAGLGLHHGKLGGGPLWQRA